MAAISRQLRPSLRLHQLQQKYTAAEQLYQRALESSGKLPGAQGREMSSTLMNLASLYHDQKRYAEDAPPIKSEWHMSLPHVVGKIGSLTE
ncbi:MAG: tetratricopeptide repeat protein [Acidobacteria bacterium]|nr:tetratricopeptide repeat protein [Acidobacteriota bacterium]